MLRIRDVYPGSDFFHPGSEFFPSRIRIKEFKYFYPKKWFLSSALGNMIRDVHHGSGSWPFKHPGSRGRKGTGFRIRNTAGIGIYSTELGPKFSESRMPHPNRTVPSCTAANCPKFILFFIINCVWSITIRLSKVGYAFLGREESESRTAKIKCSLTKEKIRAFHVLMSW